MWQSRPILSQTVWSAHGLCDLGQVTPAVQACFLICPKWTMMRAKAMSPGAWHAVVIVTAKFIAVKPARADG